MRVMTTVPCMLLLVKSSDSINEIFKLSNELREKPLGLFYKHMLAVNRVFLFKGKSDQAGVIHPSLITFL